MDIKNMKMTERTKLGLIGKNISYSFSKAYFTEKFRKSGIKHLRYDNYDLPEIDEFPFIIYMRRDEFMGFNVTIPYKRAIMRYLDTIDEVAETIGAVNTIKVNEDDELVGYNTDVYGFKNSLKPLLTSAHKKALVLGTGGASKAVAYTLNQLDITIQFVSRNKLDSTLTYDELNDEIINDHKLIINCTPLGTHPKIEECPLIPYEAITNEHLMYDLIYNPERSLFLKKGEAQGAVIKNGLEMLELQAEESWSIWNSDK